MKKSGQFSLKTKLIAIVLICWFIPFLLTAGVIAFYVSGSHLEGVIGQKRTQLAFQAETCSERLNAGIDSAKAISYEREFTSEYQKYIKGSISAREFTNYSNSYLYRHYHQDDWVQDMILWFRDTPENIECEVYNVRKGGGYPDIQKYWQEDHEKIAKLADGLGTKTAFYQMGSRLYLVRNLVDSSFKPIATMVVRINKEYCFETLLNPLGETSITVELDEYSLDLAGAGVTNAEMEIENPHSLSGYSRKSRVLRMFYNIEGEGYKLLVKVREEDGAEFAPLYGYQVVLGSILLSLMPLLYLILKGSKRYVTRPIEVLMQGAEEIEQGRLGHQIEYEPGDQEFAYLIRSFNQMSERLKYQFDHIYEEEMALLDARFMALQSNINPHFMNNTLEIINWEARMAGNNKVSEMIEALSTLMDGAMDRNQKPEVLLSEELRYVEAYLFIIAKRFGDRLRVYNRLGEELKNCPVPRLILQPVIENAIEHGALRTGSGTVTLEGHREGAFLYLDVINEGTLTEENLQKVARLLDPDYDISYKSTAHLGIANVNQRLRILYGETCGLSIAQRDNKYVRARLTVLVDK